MNKFFKTEKSDFPQETKFLKYEEYGIDIINRLIEISQRFDNYLPCVMQPDGSKGQGIPDNWGQATVASAMIEGLAGVVDEGSGFDKVSISPRWAYTDQKEVKVNIAYGPSGKSIAYDFQRTDNEISLKVSGDLEQLTCRILLPEQVESAQVRVNGLAANSNIQKIRDSRYMVIHDLKGNKHNIKLSW